MSPRWPRGDRRLRISGRRCRSQQRLGVRPDGRSTRICCICCSIPMASDVCGRSAWMGKRDAWRGLHSPRAIFMTSRASARVSETL